MQSWQMQEAKAHISEVVKLAQSQGPQEITMHGRPIAVVISLETFNRMSQANDSLVDFMLRSPLYGAEDIEFERDSSFTREVAF